MTELDIGSEARNDKYVGNKPSLCACMAGV
jgi:hypothetical protein